MKRCRPLRWTCVLVAALAACATPSERYTDRASALGFGSTELRGEGFRHRAYTAGIDRGDTLHVYVEHDGRPWVEHRYPSADPTPRTPIALELMARDDGPRLLLGRPCYYEYVTDPGCGPLLWTHRRYAPEIVASMVAAVREFIATRGYRRVVLIGYSGGGTLAWLMARDIPEAVGVVTVAANLDIDAWTTIHDFTPLEGSQNPALIAPLSSSVAQVNFVGGRDLNVPPSVVASFGRKHPDARLVVVDEYDHECCWPMRWRELLASVTSR